MVYINIFTDNYANPHKKTSIYKQVLKNDVKLVGQ